MNLKDTGSFIAAIQKYSRTRCAVRYTHRGCKVVTVQDIDAMDCVRHEHITLTGPQEGRYATL